MARVLFLLRCIVKEDTRNMKLATVQHRECVAPLDAVDDALEHFCLQWPTTYGGDYDGEVGRYVKGNDYARAQEWFGAIFSQSPLSTACVARGNTGAHPCTGVISWTRQRYRTNRLLRKPAMRGSKVKSEQQIY